MISRAVIIGLDHRGHEVLDRMSSAQRESSVVIDTDLALAGLGTCHGARPVIGIGTDLGVLRAADVPRATRVIVTVADDAVALRILSAVRWINEQAVLPHVLRAGDRVLEVSCAQDNA